MKKLLLGIFAGLMLMTFSSQTEASLLSDGNGCYYWNGDRNYLAVVRAPNYVRFVRMDSCRFATMEDYGYRAVQVILSTGSAEGNSVIFNDVAYILPNGSIKHGFGGGWERVSIGNTNSVVRAIYNAAR